MQCRLISTAVGVNVLVVQALAAQNACNSHAHIFSLASQQAPQNIKCYLRSALLIFKSSNKQLFSAFHLVQMYQLVLQLEVFIVFICEAEINYFHSSKPQLHVRMYGLLYTLTWLSAVFIFSIGFSKDFPLGIDYLKSTYIFIYLKRENITGKETKIPISTRPFNSRMTEITLYEYLPKISVMDTGSLHYCPMSFTSVSLWFKEFIFNLCITCTPCKF